MMASLDVDKVLNRWADRGDSREAKDKYIEKVNAVSESPMALAATDEALKLYEDRVRESVASGKRKQKLLARTLEYWKRMTGGKGADRIGPGMKASKDKMREHLVRWLPKAAEIHNAVKSMPRGTRAAAKERAAKAIDMSMDFAGRS